MHFKICSFDMPTIWTRASCATWARWIAQPPKTTHSPPPCPKHAPFDPPDPPASNRNPWSKATVAKSAPSLLFPCINRGGFFPVLTPYLREGFPHGRPVIARWETAGLGLDFATDSKLYYQLSTRRTASRGKTSTRSLFRFPFSFQIAWRKDSR